MGLSIKPAEKIKQYARICLWGTAKAGKTHGALALATALAGEDGKVGVISSEYGSSKLLSAQFPHDIIDLAEVDERGNLARNAFSPQRYEEALKLFTQNGYKAIVIDSLSHAWAGDGGILEIVESVGKNSFNDGWGKATPAYNALVQAILSSRCHIIVTLRAKDKYVNEEYIKRDGTRGSAPKNVGEAPVMRKGFAYEMHLVMRVEDMIGHVEASATQKYIPKGEQIPDIGPELARRLLDALDGVDLPEPTSQQIEMRRLLDEFYALSPATYARITGWEQIALRKALDIPEGEIVPIEYTDDDVRRMDLYVASKRKEKASKAS